MSEANLRLRAVEPEDVDFMYECEMEPDAAVWSDYRAPMSKRQLLDYALTYDADPFAAGQLRLIIERRDGERIGLIDLYDISEKDRRAFAGIFIHPDFRGQALGHEAVEALKAYCEQQLGIEQLAVKISTENHPALELFKKRGFRSIAILPRWHRLGNRFHDFELLVYFFQV